MADRQRSGEAKAASRPCHRRLHHRYRTLPCLAGIWHRAGDAPTFASRLINGCVAIATNVRILWALMLTLLILWRQKRISKKLVLRYLPVAVMISAAYGIVFASGVTLDRVAFHAEMMTLLALLALWWQTVGIKAMRILGIVMTAVALTLYAPALAMCCQQVDNYRYAVAQMKQPGVSIIQTCDVRPANTLEAYRLRTLCHALCRLRFFQLLHGV